MSDDATTIARDGIIGEQNEIIAAAYDALLDARDRLALTSIDHQTFTKIDAAIKRIECYRQKRDPAQGDHGKLRVTSSPA